MAESEHGLLWAFAQILKSKDTGVIVLEWPAAGREPFRKEIVFHQGEPIAEANNRPAESLTSFLLQKQKISSGQVTTIQEKMRADQINSVAAIMQLNLIPSAEIAGLLEEYFRFRLFNALSLSRGTIEYRKMDQIPQKLFEKEQVKLSQTFSAIFWTESKKYLDLDYCRSRFSKRSGQGLKVKGDCPLPLGPADLREWNSLSRSEIKPLDAPISSQQLLVIALEFEQLSFGESPSEKMKLEISLLLSRFKKSNPYEILGIAEDAKADVVKKAHLQLIKKHHPDRLPQGSDKDLRSQCEQLLAIVNEAADILMDPVKRENFEAERALEKMGGREAIEQQLQAELKHDEAVVALRRRNYKQSYDLMKPLESKLKDNIAFVSDFQFAKFMVDQEAKIFQKTDVPKLIQTFDQCLSRDRSNLWPLFYKGTVYKLTGDSQKAIAAFEELLEKNPHSAEAASELRVLRMRQDKDKDKDKKSKGGSWFKKD